MKKVAFALSCALLLSACAGSLLTVEQPYTGSQRYEAAQLEYDDSSVPVDQNNIDYTTRAMDAALFDGETPIFRRGDGITVRYRYVGFNEGSRVGRYLTAGIGGSSKVLLEADFVGPNGTLLARVRGEGSVSGGLFGGSNKTGIDKAVEEIADYAARTFR
jgi:hypothetical protein